MNINSRLWFPTGVMQKPPVIYQPRRRVTEKIKVLLPLLIEKHVLEVGKEIK